MDTLAVLMERLDGSGIPAERTILLGFSQGACLVLEFAARHPRRYVGVAGLSGGLIGPDGTPRDYDGSLAETPVFLGCSDIDPHIPKDRVIESGQVLERLGGRVNVRIYTRPYSPSGHHCTRTRAGTLRRNDPVYNSRWLWYTIFGVQPSANPATDYPAWGERQGCPIRPLARSNLPCSRSLRQFRPWCCPAGPLTSHVLAPATHRVIIPQHRAFPGNPARAK